MYNEQQLEAINALDGRVRIIAGAGSGKTTVLTERYVKLLEKEDPYNILCVTFTNKAANEMKTRIESKVGELKHSLICTFHSFCLRVLRESVSRLGYPSNFVVLDTDDQKGLIKKVYKDCGIDYNILKYNQALEYVEKHKTTTAEGLMDVVCNNDIIEANYENYKNALKRNKNLTAIQYQDLTFKCIYNGYLYYQQKNTGLDFNDLIIITLSLLKQHNDILTKWQNRLHYIMVDEFQDASYRQYELVTLLSQKYGNLFVVGDPDQTIYSWRGARPEILVNFNQHGSQQTKTIILNQNYRSTPNILNVANELIAKNTLRVKKDLFTLAKDDKPVFYSHLENTEEEAKYVANTIKQALQKYEPKDIAILYRMHFLSRAIEEQLIRNKIPYKIYSGVNFYERKEIKDVLCYLRLINNTNDDLAFERIVNVPKRGIGDKKIEKLKEYAKEKNCSLYQAMLEAIQYESVKGYQDFLFLISVLKSKIDKPEFNLADFTFEVIKMSGYNELLNGEMEEERKENVQELLKAMRDYKSETTLGEYLQDIALMTNTDDKTNRNVVSLMTIHSSKGLEFPIVYVVGMNDNYFPSKRCTEENEMEEERRLAYVAYTRAKNVLLLSDSGGYTYNGDEKETSRFVTEINRKYLQVAGKPTKQFDSEKQHKKVFVVKKR